MPPPQFYYLFATFMHITQSLLSRLPAHCTTQVQHILVLKSASLHRARSTRCHDKVERASEASSAILLVPTRRQFVALVPRVTALAALQFVAFFFAHLANPFAFLFLPLCVPFARWRQRRGFFLLLGGRWGAEQLIVIAAARVP